MLLGAKRSALDRPRRKPGGHKRQTVPTGPRGFGGFASRDLCDFFSLLIFRWRIGKDAMRPWTVRCWEKRSETGRCAIYAFFSLKFHQQTFHSRFFARSRISCCQEVDRRIHARSLGGTNDINDAWQGVQGNLVCWQKKFLEVFRYTYDMRCCALLLQPKPCSRLFRDIFIFPHTFPPCARAARSANRHTAVLIQI